MRIPRSNPLVASLVKFCIVGATGVAVNSGALYALYELGQLPLLLASVFAVELAIVNNFVLNNRWTFGAHDLSAARFVRFNLVSLGGLAITTGTLYALHGYGVHYLFANLVGIGVATLWNFVLNASWTWRWVD